LGRGKERQKPLNGPFVGKAVRLLVLRNEKGAGGNGDGTSPPANCGRFQKREEGKLTAGSQHENSPLKTEVSTGGERDKIPQQPTCVRTKYTIVLDLGGGGVNGAE